MTSLYFLEKIEAHFATMFIRSVSSDLILGKVQCVSESPRGRVSAELSKPVERKGAMCVVLV